MNRKRHDGYGLIAVGVGLVVLATAVTGARPAVSRQEAEMLDRVADLAETNRVMAVEVLQAAREDSRASAALDYSAGNLLLSLDDFEAAQGAYERALQKQPDFPEAVVGLARSLALQERWGDAEGVLRPLAIAADADLDVLVLHGYVLLAQDRLVSAETVYRRAVLVDADAPAAVMGLARSFLGQHRYSESAAILREWVQREPSDLSAWQLLAESEWAAGRKESALTALETARRLGPLPAPMLTMLGDLYASRGMADAAVQMYEAAFAQPEADADVLFRWVEGLLALDRTDAAAERLEAAPADWQNRARYQELRMRWAEAAGQPEPAREAVERWIELDPVNENALLAMGDAEMDAGDLEAAELWYDRARLAHAQRPAPLLRLARLELDRGRYQEAARWLEQAHVLTGEAHIERSLQQVRRLAEWQ